MQKRKAHGDESAALATAARCTPQVKPLREPKRAKRAPSSYSMPPSSSTSSSSSSSLPAVAVVADAHTPISLELPHRPALSTAAVLANTSTACDPTPHDVRQDVALYLRSNELVAQPCARRIGQQQNNAHVRMVDRAVIVNMLSAIHENVDVYAVAVSGDVEFRPPLPPCTLFKAVNFLDRYDDSSPYCYYSCYCLHVVNPQESHIFDRYSSVAVSPFSLSKSQTQQEWQRWP